MFYRKYFLIFLSFLSSCTSISEQVNNQFLKTYGAQVEQINNKRLALDPNNQVEQCTFLGMDCSDNKTNWNNPTQVFGIENSESAKSAFIDTSNIQPPKTPENFLPDDKTLLEGQNSPKLPENMFEISYGMENFPASYGRSGISFDDIAIPKQDAFGVNTDLGEKNYTLVGKKTLQANIDFINQNRDQYDAQISRELIAEQKDLRRKKHLKLTTKLEKDDEIKDEKADNTSLNPQNSKDQNNPKSDSKKSGGLTREIVK